MDTPILDRAVNHLNEALYALQEARVSNEIVRDRMVSVVIGMASATDGIVRTVGMIRREAQEDE